MFRSWRRRLENVKSVSCSPRGKGSRRRSSASFFKPKLELLEERIALNYSFGATPFEAINLVSGNPGVFTIINYADDAAASVDLGTNQFNFYGTTYTGANSLFVSSNGLITFGSGDANFLNTDLTNNPSQASISPLWEDFFKFTGGPMLLGEFDTVNNRLIIQWDQIRDPASTNPVTFEAILQLNTGNTPGDITFNYSLLDYFNGAAATVGLKDAGVQGPNRVLVSFKAADPLVVSGAAILFTPQEVPPVLASLSPASLPEGSAPTTLTVAGSNFTSDSVVEANGVALTTTFVSDSQLQAAVPVSMLAEEGTLAINVLGPAGGSNTQDLTITDAPLTVSSQNPAGVEGQALTNLLVATFTDSGSDGTTGDYSTTVTWDDGAGQSHSSTGTIQAAGNNTFNVYASNTVPYAEEGGHGITVAINDLGGSNGASTGTVNVADAPLSLTAQTVLATEGSTFTGVVASLTDADAGAAAGDYAAVINWGDGTSSQGTVTPNASVGFDVNGSHTYAEEGSYQINVTATDLGGSTVAIAATASIADAPLTVAGTTIASTEGASFTGVVASFIDANSNGAAGEFTATITWGDGQTSSGTITANAGGGFAVTGTHTYAEEGINAVSVTITDAGGSVVTATGTANVADAPLSAAGTTIASTEGASFTGAVASFTDANPNGAAGEFTATITWGDGQASAGTITANAGSGFIVTGTHTYAEEGVNAVSVTITDAGGSVVTATGTVNVGDAPLTAAGTTLASTEGASFAGAVASFTDANPNGAAGEFAATIAWGDGQTSSGMITASASGGFTVTGTHTYAEEGANVVSVTITDAGSSVVTVNSTANVVDAALTATGAIIFSTEGASFAETAASFTDANPNGAAGDFAATITWGDGHTSSGTITANGGTFAVTGAHTYAEEGIYLVSVTITDAGGSVATAESAAIVFDAELSVVSEATVAGFQNMTTGQQPLAVFGDAAGVETGLAEYRATIDWGDGTPSQEGVIGISNGTITVFGSHTFAGGGTFHPHITLADVGSSITGMSTVNVATDVSNEVRAWNAPPNGSALEEIDFVKNTSDGNITGPFQVVLTGLDPSISLVSASMNGVPLAIGFTATGDPYITVDLSTLTIGQPLKIYVQFSNPLGLYINYDVETFADQFTT